MCNRRAERRAVSWEMLSANCQLEADSPVLCVLRFALCKVHPLKRASCLNGKFFKGLAFFKGCECVKKGQDIAILAF